VRQTPADEPYDGWEWYSAVECTDSSNPTNPWVWPRYARRADREAGPFGSPWVFFSQPCATWPAADPDRYTGPWDRQTANPILLIGNSLGDPATPYEDAQSTERILADARLLTLESFGHTAHGGLSRCIDAAVDRYMIRLLLPPPGKVCQPDLGPFDPFPETLDRKRDESLPPSPAPVVPAD
jgi:TAP-like protein